MAKAFYIGVDGKARLAKKMYIGVDGKAHKVKKYTQAWTVRQGWRTRAISL